MLFLLLYNSCASFRMLDPFEVFVPALPPTNQKALIEFMNRFGPVVAASIWTENTGIANEPVLRGVLRFWSLDSATVAIRDASRHQVFFQNAPLAILRANRSRLGHIRWCLPPVLSEF